MCRCKPGWCICLKPPAEAPLAISSPRAGVVSASNKGAVLAAGGGVGGAGRLWRKRKGMEDKVVMVMDDVKHSSWTILNELGHGGS